MAKPLGAVSGAAGAAGESCGMNPREAAVALLGALWLIFVVTVAAGAIWLLTPILLGIWCFSLPMRLYRRLTGRGR
jgi:hypothetical protein